MRRGVKPNFCCNAILADYAAALLLRLARCRLCCFALQTRGVEVVFVGAFGAGPRPEGFLLSGSWRWMRGFTLLILALLTHFIEVVLVSTCIAFPSSYWLRLSAVVAFRPSVEGVATGALPIGNILRRSRVREAGLFRGLHQSQVDFLTLPTGRLAWLVGS